MFISPFHIEIVSFSHCLKMDLFDVNVNLEAAKTEIRKFPKRLNEVKKISSFYGEIGLLHFACLNNMLEYAQLLVQEGIDLHKRDEAR
jgi:hypothetical protein